MITIFHKDEIIEPVDRYVNKYQGVVSLFVNGLFLCKKPFRNRKQRKKIMTQWAKAFEKVESNGQIYMELYHYEVNRRYPKPTFIEKKPRGRPKKKIYKEVEAPQPIERAPTGYTNTRLYDHLIEQ